VPKSKALQEKLKEHTLVWGHLRRVRDVGGVKWRKYEATEKVRKGMHFLGKEERVSGGKTRWKKRYKMVPQVMEMKKGVRVLVENSWGNKSTL